ncbi:MAG: terminase, partial [Oscillospiraceae bacterium]|nr:terminase [Oscillospiraceae bacterium]
RGRATGLIFNLENKNIISTAQAKDFEYKKFSAALDTSYSQNSEDTFAFTFVGITADRKCVVLDETVYNNRDLKTPISPSDIPHLFMLFLEANREQWGFARDVYIDSADQATITECMKYKRLTGCVYNFIPAFKKTKIIDRIHLQSAWLAAGDFLILSDCKNYISELNIYSWKEDKYEPEDRHDHCINSVQYAWLPYKTMIGSVNIETK